MRLDKIFHVISNTHWDREWRFPFQRNRQMLVDMIDNVLNILESEPEYRAFHLDSQSIVLYDYLQIKPDKKDLIIKLVKANRLSIGPWYILPEEFQVGGENLIRNLLLGHKVCKEHGGVSKIGYSPFSWGQISQLPQIYNEFGIDVIMFYRGVNSLDSKHAEFIWEGADGTKTLTSRFSTLPRYNFYFYIYRPIVHNEGFSDVEYKWSRGGVAFHFSDSKQYNDDYFIPAPSDSYHKENVKKQVEAIITDQADDFTTAHVIWMEGHDSSGPNIKTVKIIRDIKETFPGMDVRHSTLEEYSKLLKENVNISKLPLVKGERRSAQYDRRSGNMYGYTTSARMFLKQINFDAERWVQYYAEPFNSAAGLLGYDNKDEYLNIAWNNLIQNSAHDSIGGCSLDDIHEDMINRYKHTIEIAKGVFERASKHIAVNLNLKNFNFAKSNDENYKPVFITAVNPNQYRRSEIIKAFIDIPDEYDEGAIKLYDENGIEAPVQLINSYKVEPVVEQMIDRPMFFKMNRYECYIFINDVPKFGYKSFEAMPTKKFANSKNFMCKLRKETARLENDFLKVKINKNGTLNITDKVTGKSFNNIGYFFDEGEAGHAWTQESVKPILTSLKTSTDIIPNENGALSASVLIKHKMRMPLNLEERKKKKGKTSKLIIELTVSLTKTSRRVEFNVCVKNNAESHRLRMMFPTRTRAVSSFGEGQFDVVERHIKHINAKDWIEQPMYDYPLHQFVDVSDDRFGVAILVDGLKEYEVIEDKERTIAITLLRGFKFIIAPSSVEDYSYQKGSQCLGEQNYRLAFYPHLSNWQQGKVYEEALNFNNTIRLFQSGRSSGNLPPSGSFISIDNDNLIFSSFKRSEEHEAGCYTLRLYNPSETGLKSLIKFAFNILKVEQVTLEELPLQNIKLINKTSFSVLADAKKIITYKIYFE